jgi:hypothetical protein
MLALQWLGGREVVARRAQVTDNRIGNPRARASVRGEKEDDRSNDNAKNAEEGINPSVEWRGVRIGFGWHGI